MSTGASVGPGAASVGASLVATASGGGTHFAHLESPHAGAVIAAPITTIARNSFWLRFTQV